MKEKIKEVQEYFKAKILNGQFEVVESRNHVVMITVDNEFRFSLWVYTESSFEQWLTDPNAMFLGEFNEEERQKGFELFSNIQKELRLEELKTKKLEEFKQLQSELQDAGIINNQSDIQN